VSVDDLFDDTPKGKYWYRNGFNPKAIAALIPSVAVGLVISFIPALHEVANFSWFIGVFLGGVTYRWLARDERETAARRVWLPRGDAKRVTLLSGRSVLRPVQTGTVLAVFTPRYANRRQEP
jgi:hypothetical protein